MDRKTALQIIEANLNRLREGIRVAEDLLRYTPGAEGEFRRLKAVRLEAGKAEKKARGALGPRLRRARRLKRDAGRDVTPKGELARSELKELATVNLKRAQEAARTIEEMCKLAGEAVLSRYYKKLRFALYARETEVAAKLAALSRRERFAVALKRFPVYLVIDEKNTDEQTPRELTQAFYQAGGRVAQLRMKQASARAQLKLASELQGDFAELMLIINDRVDIAQAAGAFGVHLGPADLPLSSLADIRGELLAGLSTGGAAAAAKAVAAGADYIGVGAIYRTESKQRMRIVGIEGLRKVVRAVQAPVVAIGGITADNLAQVLKAGATGCAVISAAATEKDAGKLYSAARKLARR